jgi:hypothetical protein
MRDLIHFYNKHLSASVVSFLGKSTSSKSILSFERAVCTRKLIVLLLWINHKLSYAWISCINVIILSICFVETYLPPTLTRGRLFIW